MPTEDYMTFPTQFAQAILQVKNSLAQKAAEIRELQETRQMQHEVEMARIASQQQIAAGNQNIEAARVQSTSQLGNREMANREAEMQLRADQIREKLKDEKEARKQNIIAQIGQGNATYVPPDVAVTQDMLTGPTVETTDQEGKKISKPAFTMKMLPDPGTGGHFIFPITDALTGLKFDKLTQENTRIASSTALNTARIQQALASADYVKAKRAQVGAISPMAKIQYNKDFLTLVQMAEKNIDSARMEDLAKGINDSNRVREMQADLSKALPQDPKFQSYYKDVQAVAYDLLHTANSLPPEYRSQYIAPTTDLGRKALNADPLSTELENLINENRPDSIPKFEPNHPQDFPGFIDSSKGPSTFRAGYGPPGKGEIPATKRNYYDATGKVIGSEFLTPDGRIIHSAGQVPSAGQPPQAVPIAPMTPGTAPPTSSGPSRLEILAGKILNNTSTPEEEAEFRRLGGE